MCRCAERRSIIRMAINQQIDAKEGFRRLADSVRSDVKDIVQNSSDTMRDRIARARNRIVR